MHHGLRQARYIGKAKVYLQSLLIGAIVNFKRYWKLINEKVATKKADIVLNGVVNIAKATLPVLT